MQYKLAVSAALMGLAHLSTATTCTSQNAIPIEQYISSGGGGSGGGGGGGGAGVFLSVDPFNVMTNAVKKRATPDAKFANVALAIAARSAGSVECSTTEMCFSVQGTPFCLDVLNGDFHDGVGTSGNALTGDYTLGDGRKGNLYKGPFPQPTGTAAYSLTASTTAAAGTSKTGAAGAGKTAAADAGETESAAAGSSAGGATGAANTPAATGAGQSAATNTPKNNGAAKGMSAGAAIGGLMGVVGALVL